MRTLLARYNLERAVRLTASPLPIQHPKRRLYFLLGLGLGAAIPLVLRPAPKPVAAECPAPAFELPKPTAEQLEPVWPPGLWERWQPGGDLYAKHGPLQDLAGGQESNVQLPEPEPSRC